MNEAGTSSDHLGHLAMVPLMIALLTLKTWWREGLPGGGRSRLEALVQCTAAASA